MGTPFPSSSARRSRPSRGSRGSIEHGAQLAVDEINADGGVQLKAGKKQLKLVVLDNGGSPATALANAREAVKRNAAALLTDGTGAVSVASVTDPAKLPVFVLFDGRAEPDRPADAPDACSGSPRPTRS